MSIRLIARELYRLQQAVERIEKQFREAPFDRQPELEEVLRKTKAERDRMKSVLAGQKDHAMSQKRTF